MDKWIKLHKELDDALNSMSNNDWLNFKNKMEDKKWSTGAWKKQTAKGEVINFTINGVKYSMWQNTYKKDEKQPDFKIVVNDFKPKDEPQSEKNDLPF